MEFFVFVLVIVVLVVLVNFKNSTSKKFDALYNKLIDLQTELNEAKKQTAIHKPVTETPPATGSPVQASQSVYNESNFKDIIQPEQPVIKVPSAEETFNEPLASENLEVPVIPPTMPQAAFVQQPKIAQRRPTFFERNPDLEKFIGENLISKIGIGILVIAIGYFVKFAIDNNWIGEAGRVAIGITCGAILCGLGYRTRKNYKAFSSVLTGGGLAVFYFTISLAYHQFHLFGQSTAFVIMLVITALAVALSLLYDRQELAIIALVGGFTAPFMVSNGSGNYNTLFIYLILLNTGLLFLAYRKTWRLLNLLAFIFTVLLAGGWLFTTVTYHNGLIYFTIFYVLFFAINLAHNIRENKKFIASDFGILLLNTAFYFSSGLYLLYQMEAELYKGLFSAAVGLFNLAASYLFFRNRKIDANILYLLIGITLTCVSLTAPLQLDGNFITLFWASECVLLYWLFQKSRIAIIEASAMMVWCCMVISLLMDWNNIYGDTNSGLRIVFNKGYVTTLYCAIATYMLPLLAKGRPARGVHSSLSFLPISFLSSIAVSILFAGGVLEVNHQFLFYYPGSNINLVYVQAYAFAFVLILLFISGLKPLLNLPVWLRCLLPAVCIFIYLLLISFHFILQQQALTRHQYAALFNSGHIAVMLLTISIFAVLIRLFQKHTPASDFLQTLFAWLLCISLVVFASAEFDLLARSVFYSSQVSIQKIQTTYNKTALPILWGLCSFIFMWVGMRHKFKPLRIVSLSLFTLTLAKLFLFDIRNIPIAGKIAAFFCLGVLLLVVSFMYQRLKKIIIDDGQKTAD